MILLKIQAIEFVENAPYKVRMSVSLGKLKQLQMGYMLRSLLLKVNVSSQTVDPKSALAVVNATFDYYLIIFYIDLYTN